MTAVAILGAASLVALSRAEFAYEKKLVGWGRFFDFAAATLCFASSFLSVTVTVVGITLLAAGATVGGRIMAFRARGRHLVAERIRRALALREGLGFAPDPQDEGDMRASVSDRAQKTAGRYDETTYYRIEGPSGPERLRRLIQESAFWTGHLCRAAATQRLWPTVAIVPAVIAVVVSVSGTGIGSLALITARAVAIGLCTFVGLETVSESLTFSTAADNASQIDRRLEGISPNPRLEVLLPQVTSYDVLAATIPAIPERLYKREHDRLSAIWEGRLAGYRAPPDSASI